MAAMEALWGDYLERSSTGSEEAVWHKGQRGEGRKSCNSTGGTCPVGCTADHEHLAMDPSNGVPPEMLDSGSEEDWLDSTNEGDEDGSDDDSTDEEEDAMAKPWPVAGRAPELQLRPPCPRESPRRANRHKRRR